MLFRWRERIYNYDEGAVTDHAFDDIDAIIAEKRNAATAK